MTTSRLEYRDLELPAVPEETSRRRRWWLGLPLGLLLVAIVYQLVRGDLWQRAVLAREWLDARTRGSAAPAAAEGGALLSHEVQVIDLAITALESGTLESASSSPVHSEVAGQAAIIRLVPEGSRVAQGDVVVELDSSGLKKQLTDQQIVVERSGNAVSQAQQASASAESKAQSDLAKAELALEFARLDLEKYVQGEYPLQLRTLEIEIANAQELLERARVQLSLSEELARDRYIHQGEVEADRSRVRQATDRLENARENARLLEQYTYPRGKRDLEAKVTEAERALALAKRQAEVDAEQARTNLGVQERTLELERAKLERLERQIEKCTLRAPQAGIVVYPVPQDEDAVELYIKQGTLIREQQHVFSIPDTDVLQVSTSLHEAKVNQIKPGMQARVWIDVYSELELRGEVQSVAKLPEPGDWRRTAVKFYETKVKLLDQAEGLRPGMSAKVEILIEQRPGVLAVPVQSVVQRGRTGLCYVLAPTPALRRLHLGKASTEFVEVLEGLVAGERIVLSPDFLGIPEAELQQAEQVEWNPAAPAGPGATEAPPEVAVQETEYEAVLLGPGNAIAEAQFETQVAGEDTKREFDVKIQGGPPGATLEVSVAGIVVGSVTLDELGACDFEWNSKYGTFPANFPLDAGPGTAVQIGELQGTLN